MSMLFGDEMSVTQGTKSNEWYTPAKYIEAARTVMGGIDLDPASCEMANETVKATRYYSLKNNGLNHDWSGRIWLNPPYGKVNPIPGSVKSYQKIFVQKLLHEYAAGRIEQAILLLLGNSCFAHYFYPLWNHPLCFHDGYISFYKPDGTTDDFGFGTIFVYLGPNESKFIEVFSQFGRVVRAIDTPKPAQVVQPDLWSNESEVAS
jgi:ParB family chromosome partitioning protein